MIADLALDLASALDPVVYARRQAGFAPDDWQAEMLRSSADAILLNCSRQSGKSTTVGLMTAHRAIYQPETLILLLSPSLRQSSELFRKVLDFYRVQELERAKAESKLTLELNNGSRIVSLPGKEATIRGYSGVGLLVIDEAARVPDELYYSIRPMLAVSGGQIAALSTPFGKRGWWFNEWASGGDAWQRYEVPAHKCPRIPAEFLAQERRTMGAWWFEQEYECKFLDAQSAAFAYDDVMAALNKELEVWNL